MEIELNLSITKHYYCNMNQIINIVLVTCLKKHSLLLRKFLGVTVAPWFTSDLKIDSHATLACWERTCIDVQKIE